DQDLFLGQDPVGEAPVAPVARELHAGDMDRAVRIAPYLEARPVDGERVQVQAAIQQGAPGDDVLDGGQDQRLAARGVVDAHIREAELRPQAEPARLDGADFYGLADGARDRRDDLRPVTLDVGQ